MYTVKDVAAESEKMPETLTTEQIYDRFGVEPATIRLWYRKCIIKGYKFPGTRTILIDIRSFRDHMEKHSNIKTESK